MNILSALNALASDRRLKLIYLLDRTGQTAIEIHRRFNSEYEKSGYRETIYRDLEMLVDNGIVLKNYDKKSKKLQYLLAAEKISINLKTRQIKLEGVV